MATCNILKVPLFIHLPVTKTTTYEGDVAFRASMVDSPQVEERQVFAMTFSSTNLTGLQLCFADVDLDVDANRQLYDRQNPLTLIRLLYTMQQLVSQPEYGHPSYTPGKRRRKETDDEEKIRFEAESATFLHNGRQLSKIEVYLEELTTPFQEIVGYRIIWYVVCPRTIFDVHLGLSRLLAANAAAEANGGARRRKFQLLQETKGAEKVDPKTLILSREAVVTSEVYFKTLLNDYWGAESLYDQESFKRPIIDPSCAVYLGRIFSFDTSIAIAKTLFKGHADQADISPDFLNKDNYFDEMSEYMRFPQVARKLDQEEYYPAVIHHSCLLMNDQDYRQELVGKPEASNVTKLLETHRRIKLQDRLVSQVEFDFIDNLRKQNLKDMDGMGVDEIQAHLSTPICMLRLRQLFASPKLYTDPGAKACMEYYDNLVKESCMRDETLCLMMPTWEKLDPHMSHFAAIVARMGLALEELLSVHSLHKEIVFSWIMRLGNFDSRAGGIMFTNLLLTGTHGAGKSVTLNITKDMMIPGTYLESEHETGKAATTSANLNGQMNLMDELGSHMLNHGEGNQGDPVQKARLSKGKITTFQCEVDPETRERKRVKYEFTAFATSMANTNVSEGDMPAPVADRYCIMEVAKHDRPNKDIQLSEQAVESNPALRAMRDRFMEEQRRILLLVFFVEQCIRAGFLPQVDMRAFTQRFYLIRKYMCEKDGDGIPNRQARFVENQVRACVLLEAVTRVFFTTEHFPADKSFEVKDVLQVRPYLFATEEHLVFVLTQMETVIMHTEEQDVVRALDEMCRTENGARVFLDRRDAGGNITGTDYDYLFLHLECVQQQEKEMFGRASNDIKLHISRYYNRERTENNIRKALDRMHRKSVKAPKYHGAGPEATAHQQNRSVLKWRGGGKPGFLVLRHYVEQTLAREESLLLEAIRKTCDMRTTPRALLTGDVMRDGYGHQMAPYLFKVIDLDRIPDKPCKIVNLAHHVGGFRTIFGENQEGVAPIQQVATLEIDQHIDEYYYADFCERHGIGQAPATFPIYRPGWGQGDVPRTYPTLYYTRYLQDNGWVQAEDVEGEANVPQNVAAEGEMILQEGGGADEQDGGEEYANEFGYV